MLLSPEHDAKRLTERKFMFITYRRIIMSLINLAKQNAYLRKENRRLHNLCKVKDSYFKELMSDGLRHGSKLAGKHMSDRKKYLNGK